ncbi:MAG TPA: hypothetical protein VJN29_03345 [Intrasporangium sp.]|uniref:hypothetical protein n=1 Tax=Intrasporangium sp. TaxID=1925024 RepID=UPI002B46CFD8|nr:hypothetical protein [Intrasporangium sp.]HKX66237.1 hypothetical protein [Intrasporangium sp.]
MNTIERRVADALHEHVDELPISTKDLGQLQRELHRRARGPGDQHRRDKAWTVGLAAACVALLIVLVGSVFRDGPDPKPSGSSVLRVTDLAGIWRVDSGDVAERLWFVSAAGKLAFLRSPEQLLPRRLPAFTVPIRVESGKAFTTEPNPTDCIRWQLVADGKDHLHVTPHSSATECGWRRETVVKLTRVAPRRESMEPWTSSYPTTEPTPVTNMLQLHGIWLLPGTGEVLAIGGTADSPGEYAIYPTGTEQEPTDAGQVWVPRGGGVVFVSDTKGNTCMTEYVGFTTDTATLRGRVSPTTCNRIGGVDSTWLRL